MDALKATNKRRARLRSLTREKSLCSLCTLWLVFVFREHITQQTHGKRLPAGTVFIPSGTMSRPSASTIDSSAPELCVQSGGRSSRPLFVSRSPADNCAARPTRYLPTTAITRGIADGSRPSSRYSAGRTKMSNVTIAETGFPGRPKNGTPPTAQTPAVYRAQIDPPQVECASSSTTARTDVVRPTDTPPN